MGLGLELRFVDPADPLVEDEVALRFRVLRESLGLPESAVRFDFEAESLHLLALDEGRVVGCVLFHPRGSGGRLYQMAVEASRQRGGVGRSLIQHLEAALRARGVERIELHAREAAVPFYERLGYRREGTPFVEIGLPHQHMEKRL